MAVAVLNHDLTPPQKPEQLFTIASIFQLSVGVDVGPYHIRAIAADVEPLPP